MVEISDTAPPTRRNPKRPWFGGCGCLSILALLIFCNPMLLMFLTEVGIENESAERVYSSPAAGVLQSGGREGLQQHCLWDWGAGIRNEQ